MEELVDMREMTEQELIEAEKMAEIVFKLNHTLPNSEEYNSLLKELLGDNLGENSSQSFNGPGRNNNRRQCNDCCKCPIAFKQP